MTEDPQAWPPKAHRTREEAAAWLPKARAILEEIERRVPPGQIAIETETLFVGTLIPEIVACVAVSLVGFRGQLTALEILLDPDVDVEKAAALHARRLLQWRARVEAENARREAN